MSSQAPAGEGLSFSDHISINHKNCQIHFQSEQSVVDGQTVITGRQLVSLEHPEFGVIQFFLKHVGYGWELDTIDYIDTIEVDADKVEQDYPFTLPEDIINWCRQRIDSFYN